MVGFGKWIGELINNMGCMLPLVILSILFMYFNNKSLPNKYKQGTKEHRDQTISANPWFNVILVIGTAFGIWCVFYFGIR